MPEIRLAPDAHQWLAQARPVTWLRAGSPPPTALAQLLLETDQPVNHALAGWASPPPAFPLALDPQAPASALPEAYVDERRNAGGIGLMGLVFIAVGFGVWFAGTALILPALPLPVHLLLAAMPLVASEPARAPLAGGEVLRWPRHPGFRERVRLFRELGDVPVTGVPVMSQSVAERAEQRR